MKRIRSHSGFTLAELLIVVAIIAVLVAIAIPVFNSQLEKSREATDLANVRSAYAEVMAAAITEDHDAKYGDKTIYQSDSSEYVAVVSPLKQQQNEWQSVTSPATITIGGVTSGPGGNSNDDGTWVGMVKASGSCKITCDANGKVTFTWGDGSGNTTPEPTAFSDFFAGILYKTDFWKDMSNNQNFEFDSHCPENDSKYMRKLNEKALEAGENNLLLQPDCTWAFYGDGRNGYENDRYLVWSSLDEVALEKVDSTNKNEKKNIKIPVLVQTGVNETDGPYYYIAESTPTERTTGNNNSYMSVAAKTESMGSNNRAQTFKTGQPYKSLQDAYAAYEKKLEEWEKDHPNI